MNRCEDTPLQSGTVTEPDLAANATVVIRCPACGASEAADAAAFTDAPTIVCRNCGETWPARGGRKGRVPASGSGHALSGPPARAPFLEARRAPLVGYSEGLSNAWAAKIEGDVLPEDRPPPSRLPSVLAALAAGLFIATFFMGRGGAVNAAPDLARLYAAVGLPVNLAGLELLDIAAERTVENGGNRLVLRGTIRSLSAEEQTVPALSALLYTMDGRAAGKRSFEPPAETIDAGAQMPFAVEFAPVAQDAVEVVVRFRRPEEPVAEFGTE